MNLFQMCPPLRACALCLSRKTLAHFFTNCSASHLQATWQRSKFIAFPAFPSWRNRFHFFQSRKRLKQFFNILKYWRIDPPDSGRRGRRTPWQKRIRCISGRIRKGETLRIGVPPAGEQRREEAWVAGCSSYFYKGYGGERIQAGGEPRNPAFELPT